MQATHAHPDLTSQLLALYSSLHDHYGHEPHWWPSFGPDRAWEIMLGALLVQQSKWERVEGAILRLLDAGLYAPAAIAAASPAILEPLLVGVAFPRQKAPQLLDLAQHVVVEARGEVAQWLAAPLPALRAELVSRPGIGPETADAILLYAGNHEVFVVDAYLRRLFGRLGIISDSTSLPYEQLRLRIEAALPPDIDLQAFPHLQASRAHFFADYHALINEHCIHHCLASRPHCDTTSAPRRPFTPPQKCATHCPPCDGCSLRAVCLDYRVRRSAVVTER